MTQSNSDHSTLSTFAKVFLNDWTALRNVLSEHTRLIKDAVDSSKPAPDAKLSLFNDQQIQDALDGPYQHFFKQKMSAYATIAKTRFKLTIQQDENLKPSEEQEAKDRKENPALHKLLEKTSISSLDKMQAALNEATTAHDAAWKNQRNAWKEQLIQRINQQGVTLSDLEIQELKDEEPISELFDRFTNLKLELPKKVTQANHYSRYYKLKAKLAISSALAREHKPNTDQEIEPIVKKLKKTFESIETEETALLNAQATETDAIIESIASINLLLQPKSDDKKK